MEKSCRKYAPKFSLTPFLILVNKPKQPLHARNSFKNKIFLPFKCQINKVAKHTQTICQQFADKLFECVWPFCGIDP